MKLGAKVKEQIARTIGEYFTTNGIVNVFKDANITVQTELYAKWRMTLEAFNNTETEEAFYKIIEEFCHPLNFTDMQVRMNFVEALNKILSYENIKIEITERTSVVVDVDEKKATAATVSKKIKEEKVYILPDINKSSYSEKVLELVAKKLAGAFSYWEIHKVIKPIIEKNVALFHQQDINEYLTDLNGAPFFDLEDVFKTVRRKDKNADTTIEAMITGLLHPLNFDASKDMADNFADELQKYLDYDGLVILYSDHDKKYSISKDKNVFAITEDDATQAAYEDIFIQEQDELAFLRQPENKEKISGLRKMYQVFMNIVEVFCDNPSKPTAEMNDAYVKTKKMIISIVDGLHLNSGVLVVDDSHKQGYSKMHTLRHFFIPFGNLYTAEDEYSPKNTEFDLSGKKLTWDYIRPRMNATYGDIDELYGKIEGSDILSKPDVQETLNEVSLLVSKTKEENAKVVKAKQKKLPSQPKPLVQKIEITSMPPLSIKHTDESIVVKNKKRITLPRFPMTEWSKVSLRFLSDRDILLSDGKNTKPSDFASLGFTDERTGRPDMSWEFLLDVAKKNGETDTIPKNERETLKKRKQKVVDTLRKIYKNQSDPFDDFFTLKKYKALFQIMPPPEDKTTDPIYQE